MRFFSILSYSFAIFAMFFGSGNLVFPLQIGYASGGAWVPGFVGLLLTGILLPFLGLFVIKLYQGNVYRFFDGAGSIARIVLPFFILSLLGSFGVVPRCITVAQGGLSFIAPDVSLALFSIIFSIATFFLCLKETTMIKVLGSWMSPLLLLFLAALLIIGVIKAPALPLNNVLGSAALLDGFMTGYQTMDLFAALFFSALIFKQIEKSLPRETSDRQILRIVIVPSIISSVLLGIIYFGFVYLGSHYFATIKGVDPELMLPAIVMAVMGDYATAMIAILMVLSCLTTAVALNNIYAHYLCTALKLTANKFPWVLLLTTAISCAISMLDFKGIAKLLAPALDISYPGLIALTVLSIFYKSNHALKLYAFWGITIITVIYFLVA